MSTQTAGAEAAARVVRGGGVIAYPTDTVWGVGGDARRPDVIARVRALKGRDRRPMLVLVTDIEQVRDWIGAVPGPLRRVLASGVPVTGLLPASSAAPRVLVGVEGLVGVRVATGWVGALVERIGAPLLSTSANRSGEAPPQSRSNLADGICRGVDLVADGPEPPGGAPSTLVRFDGDALVIVRPGSVEGERLAVIAGCQVRSEA